MKGTDGILALLQDIKEMLLGIFLLIFGCFLFLFGLMGGGAVQILVFIGLPVVAVGFFFAVRAFNRHEVVSTPDSTKNKEAPDAL